jgi:hypothetical protein
MQRKRICNRKLCVSNKTCFEVNMKSTQNFSGVRYSIKWQLFVILVCAGGGGGVLRFTRLRTKMWFLRLHQDSSNGERQYCWLYKSNTFPDTWSHVGHESSLVPHRGKGRVISTYHRADWCCSNAVRLYSNLSQAAGWSERGFWRLHSVHSDDCLDNTSYRPRPLLPYSYSLPFTIIFLSHPTLFNLCSCKTVVKYSKIHPMNRVTLPPNILCSL